MKKKSILRKILPWVIAAALLAALRPPRCPM